ncbi:MAG: 3'-5' exonuclease [Patescibacteria group bacterium]
MSFSKIAFTDFEMSGLDPLRHDIVEFGAVVADAETLEVIAEMDKKVRMERPENADGESLVFLGYRDELWKDAISIQEALAEYSALTQGAMFAAWNTPSDWSFLMETYRRLGIKNPLDYHTLDVVGIAYEKLRHEADLTLKLTGLCKRLGIEKEPMPHRAINGARTVYKVYKKLRAL